MLPTTPLRISVVIPVYNAAAFIEQAVDSALQFEDVVEVILVEDGGPDNSLAVCEAIAQREPRVKLLRHPGGVNLGASASRNLGIMNATQEFIAFLDADDHYLPNRFDQERRIFREHADADGVYGAIGPHYHDEVGKAHFKRTFESELTTVHIRVPPEDLFNGLLGVKGFGYFSLIALTVKRTALDRLETLFRTDLSMHEDSDLIMRLAWYTRLYAGSIEEPVSMRGVHANNRITQNSGEALSRKEQARYRWEWMVSAGVDPKIIERFHLQYRIRQIATAPDKLSAVQMAFAHRHYLRNYDHRDALFSRLLGPDSAVKNALHKITWKIYGASDPKTVQ